MSFLSDVKAFHARFGMLDYSPTDIEPRHVTRRKLCERLECMREELVEFEEAIETQDLAALADALVDIIYFAVGTAAQMNLPLQALWDDVHRANMAKVRGVGHRGHTVDVVKPESWVAPIGASILQAYGYRRRKWTTTDDLDAKIVDAWCFDDSPQS